MNWSEQLNNYCERGDASLWAEPINALSNIAFIIAAIAAWHLYINNQGNARGNGNKLMPVLILLLFAVGIGSSLFHTFATRWAMLADVIPILLLMYIYQGIFLRLVMNFRGWQVALYIPVALALCGFFLFMRMRHKQGAGSIGAAVGLFMLSLIFRTLDQTLCDTIPIGTHFMWHILNGAVLYMLLRGLMPYVNTENRQTHI